MRLEGKSAIITGSSSGIGAEIAFMFAREGASVMINCHPEDSPDGKDVLSKLQGMNCNAELCIADVSNPDDAERLIESTSNAFHKIDILVNNAGINRDSLLENMEFSQWQETLDTNLTGVFNCSKAALKSMKPQGYGKIINISSVVAEMGNIGQVNYAASKAGIIGLTKALSLECVRYGILVNAIAPGFCETRMTSSIPEKVREKIIGKIPLRRFADPKEIAFITLFLASDECSYMVGQVISANGGLHL